MAQPELAHIILLFETEQDPFKRARILKEYHEDKGVRIIDLSNALKMGSAYLCHLLRLNKLPEIVVDGYYSHLVTVSHLFIVSRLKTKEEMEKAYETILAKGLTITGTEALIREMMYEVKTDTGSYLNPEEKQKRIDQITKGDSAVSVQIIQTRIKNKLVIEIKGNLKDASAKLLALTDKLAS